MAIVEPDGTPRLSVVWLLTEDGTVSISLSDERSKAPDLLRDSRHGSPS